MATTLKINANRRNAIDLLPHTLPYRPKTLRPQDLTTLRPYDPQNLRTPSQAFSSRPAQVPLHRMRSGISITRNPRRGNTLHATRAQSIRTKAEEFDIEEARRVLGDVFAPWVQDLGLSIGSVECAPPPGAAADWQPGAVLRMAFSERLCRHGGIVCGQALMALADTWMVIAILAANRGYRPMTTVDQTTHFMRAVTQSDVLADARVVRLGRTMSFGRVTLSSAADNKPVAMVSSAFAMM